MCAGGCALGREVRQRIGCEVGCPVRRWRTQCTGHGGRGLRCAGAGAGAGSALRGRELWWTHGGARCERGAMELDTARLVIRPWSHDEAERLLDIQGRIEVVK